MESKWRLNVWDIGYNGSFLTLAARLLDAPFRSYMVQATVGGLRFRGQTRPAVLPELADEVTIVALEHEPFPYGRNVEPDH